MPNVSKFLITIILLVVLFYGRLFVVRDLNLITTIFSIVFPDLASFIPIGLATRRAEEWPRWGPSLYNFFHKFLIWIPVFVLWSTLSGGVQCRFSASQVTSRLTTL